MAHDGDDKDGKESSSFQNAETNNKAEFMQDEKLPNDNENYNVDIMPKLEAIPESGIITSAEIAEGVPLLPPELLQSRKRKRFEQVGEIVFDTLRDCKAYFRCGKHECESSPCVDKDKLDKRYPLVYEEWQLQNSGADGKQFYRCRRQRLNHYKSGKRPVPSGTRKREQSTKTEYIGCQCEARYTSTLLPKRKVRVRFFGKHNHDVQSSYAMKFLNPVRRCSAIREIIDSKLFAGLSRVHTILTSVLTEMLTKRGNKHTSFDELRNYFMTFALKRNHIRNRREQLGLNPESLAHKYVYVNKCVQRWHEHPCEHRFVSGVLNVHESIP